MVARVFHREEEIPTCGICKSRESRARERVPLLPSEDRADVIHCDRLLVPPDPEDMAAPPEAFCDREAGWEVTEVSTTGHYCDTHYNTRAHHLRAGLLLLSRTDLLVAQRFVRIQEAMPCEDHSGVRECRAPARWVELVEGATYWCDAHVDDA